MPSLLCYLNLKRNTRKRALLFTKENIDKIKENERFLEIMATALLDFILEVAEQERKKIISRTSEGHRKAVLEGRKFGRNLKVSLEDSKITTKDGLRELEIKAPEC